jgi:hypothetical protein
MFRRKFNYFLETFCIGACLFTVDVNMEQKLENELLTFLLWLESLIDVSRSCKNISLLKFLKFLFFIFRFVADFILCKIRKTGK